MSSSFSWSFSGFHQTVANQKPLFNVKETFIRFEFSLMACYKKLVYTLEKN